MNRGNDGRSRCLRSGAVRRAGALGLTLTLSSMLGCGSCGKKEGSDESEASAPSASITLPPLTSERPVVSTSSNAGPEFQKACYSVAKAGCMKLMSCPGFELRFGSYTACVARSTQGCLYEHAPKESGVKLAALEKCAQSQSTAQCADVLSDRLPGCEPAPGTIADGAACLFDSQCASQLCLRRSDESCGKCAPAPKVGEECKLDRCAAGAACVDGTCVKRQPRGGACKTTAECDDRLACVGGKCSPPASKAGDKCDPSGEAGAPCDGRAGLFCDPTSKTCAAVPLAKAGEPCGDDQQKRCGGDATCVDGKCAPLVRVGQPCKEGGAACLGIAKCVGGVCKLPELLECPK